MSKENETRSYTFEEVLITVLDKSSALRSCGFRDVVGALSCINQSLALIRNELQKMSDYMVKAKEEEKM